MPVPISMMPSGAVAAASIASWAPIDAGIGSTPSSRECWRTSAMSSRSATNSSAYLQLSIRSVTALTLGGCPGEHGYPDRVSLGLTFDKLLIIAIIAVFLLGPDRLPYYASQLARLVRRVRDFANGAKDRMREEMGPDFDDIDWKKLDPRQYDPRRIIREALLEDEKRSPCAHPSSRRTRSGSG